MGPTDRTSAGCRDIERDESMSKELAVGDQAPELSIPDQHGKSMTLKSFKGKQNVQYLYPKDETPG